MSNLIELGKSGELLVAQFIENHQFKVLEKNFKSKHGEIDIVATKDDILAFIEVKIRINPKFYLSELITLSKQKKIIKTALYYIQKNKILNEMVYRFDVALVEMVNNDYSISYIPNAFNTSEEVKSLFF